MMGSVQINHDSAARHITDGKKLATLIAIKKPRSVRQVGNAFISREGTQNQWFGGKGRLAELRWKLHPRFAEKAS